MSSALLRHGLSSVCLQGTWGYGSRQGYESLGLWKAGPARKVSLSQLPGAHFKGFFSQTGQQAASRTLHAPHSDRKVPDRDRNQPVQRKPSCLCLESDGSWSLVLGSVSVPFSMVG